MNKPEIEALLERVKAATGPDRELDFLIQIHVAHPLAGDEPYTLQDVMDDYALLGPEGMAIDATFTASIDAALALVERKLPGLVICMTKLGDGSGMFQITEAWTRDDHVVGAYDPMDPRPGALAIIEVLLTALEAQP